MISKTNVLAVSLIAFMSIYGARAEIASKAYVEQIVGAVSTTSIGAVATAQGAGNANKILVTDASGDVGTTATIANTQVSGLGGLATLSAVGSTEITDGSIMNADINASAAIAQSKIDGLATALANAQNKIPSGSEGSSTLASIWVQ